MFYGIIQEFKDGTLLGNTWKIKSDTKKRLKLSP